VGGKPVSIHAEGERVYVTGPQGGRQEVDLAAAAARASLPEPVCPAGVVTGLAAIEPEEESAPGLSPLDAVLPPTPPAAGGGA